MIRRPPRADSRQLLLLRDVGGDPGLFAREADVENSRLVPKRVAVDAERDRGAPEISRRALHRADDVFLLELLLREIERNSMGQEFVDDLLKLSVEIQVFPRASGS